MAEIRQEFTFDDKGMLDGMRAMRDLAVAIEKGFDEAADGAGKFSKEVQEDMTNSRKALDKVIDGLDKKAKATESDAKATAEWKKGLKDAADEVNILGVNLGSAIDKLKEKQKSLGNVVKGLGATGTASKRLGLTIKTTLISTGAGALIIVLGSLVAWLTKTQQGMDKVKVITAQVGSVFANVTERAAALWEGIRVFSSGEFRKGLNQMGDAFKGIGKEIVEDAKATGELTKSQLQLSKAIDLVETQREKDLARVKELNQIAEDTTKTDQERAEAAQKAMSIERASLNTLISLKQQQLSNLKQEHALSITTQADIQAEQELEREIAQLRAQSTEQQTTLQNKLNTINDRRNALIAQEAARVQALRDAYVDLVSTIEDKLAAQELDKLSGRERLKAEQDLALKEIDLLEQKARAAALAAGQEYTLANQFLQIRENIIESFKEEARELAKSETQIKKLDTAYDATAENITKSLGKIKKVTTDAFGNEVIYFVDAEQAKSAGEQNAENIAAGMKTGLERNNHLFDEIRVTMMSWLGLDATEVAIFEDSAKSLFNTFGQLYTESIDRQLDENQRLLDNLQERESIIQGQLEREIQLQEEGRANNVEGKRKELAAIRKEEEKAEKEAAKLRKRQQAAQLAANLVQQGSNLATAVTEIFAANAGIPIVGIIQAGVAIASMFASFARAKSQAQAVITQRAYKGGPLEDYLGGKRRSGFVKRGGQSDKPGRGNGYRVEGTGLVFGGDEFMMNEDDSRIHDKFLTAMNKGAFRNVDLNSLVENQAVPLSEMSKYNRLTSIRRAGIERSRMSQKDRLVVDAINRNFRELLRLEKGKKIYMSVDDYQNRVEIDANGNTRIVRK